MKRSVHNFARCPKEPTANSGTTCHFYGGIEMAILGWQESGQDQQQKLLTALFGRRLLSHAADCYEERRLDSSTSTAAMIRRTLRYEIASTWKFLISDGRQACQYAVHIQFELTSPFALSWLLVSSQSSPLECAHHPSISHMSLCGSAVCSLRLRKLLSKS